MADEEVRIVISKGYDEQSYCNDLGITTTAEAEAALENFEDTYQQYQEIAEGNGMDDGRYRTLAESTLEKFKSGEFPLQSGGSGSANGNTKGVITGQVAASAGSANESNPEVTPETPEEEENGSGWLDGVQLGLDAAGMVPGFGAFADVANAGVSVFRGDYAGAAFSLLAAIPGIGDAAAAGKMIKKGAGVLEKKAAKEAAEKAEKEAAQRAAKKEVAEKKGGKSKGKDKDGPCKIGPYSTLKCPPGNDAHHIVPDYTLRYGSRKDAIVNQKRIKGMPTLKEGMCICLSKTESTKTGRTEHRDAHDADPVIRAAGAISKVPGTVPLWLVKAKSTASVSKVKPECRLQITAVVETQFAHIDNDTLVRSDYHRLPNEDTIAVLGTIER